MERIDFCETVKALPVTKESLADKIGNTPSEVLLDYINGLNILVKKISTNMLILAAGGNLCNELLDQLDETHLNDLNNIVDILNDNNLVERFNELLKISINIDYSQKKKTKISRLMKIINDLDRFNLKNVLVNLLIMDADLTLFNRILLYYFDKDKDQEALKNYLEGIDAKTILNAISTGNMVRRMCEKLS